MCGLKSNHVFVKKDCFNKSVPHACASVVVSDYDDRILVDPAYSTHGFNVEHKKFKIVTDEEAINEYRIHRKI